MTSAFDRPSPVTAREVYNFTDLLYPDGEDNISYRYDDGTLVIDIPYELETKLLQLRFDGCRYLYFAPFPGYGPAEFGPDFSFQASRVYELLDSPQVEAAVSYYSDRYRPELRHYFMYLEWDNHIFHIIAESFTTSEPESG